MGDEIPFRVAIVLLAIGQWAVSRTYLKKAGAGSTIFQRRAEGLPLAAALVASYAAYVAGVLAYVIDPQWMAWAAIPCSSGTRWLGLLPIGLGAGLHIWGMHHLGQNLTISISTKAEHSLITTGPYRWVRHPLYTGGMIETLGVILLTANWAVALAAGLFWALIVLRTPREERELLAKFGDSYRRYREQTGRFLPKFTRSNR